MAECPELVEWSWGLGGRMGTIGKVGWELDWGRSAKVKRINVSQEP